MAQEESPRRNRFTAALERSRKGQTMAELDKAMETVIAAVRATGKGGAVHLTLRMGLASKGDNDLLTISDSVRMVVPQGDRALTILYATDENDLVLNDPRQLPLEIATPEARAEANEPPAQPTRPALVKTT